jgi:Membrane bound FAD containing D-sorbitol dehydrogenase
MGLARPVKAGQLDSFLDFSAELCGFPKSDLDPQVGELYLRTLEAVEPGSWESLLALVDNQTALSTLQRSGALNDPALETLCRRIIELWYSGVRSTLLGSQACCYEQALGWKALDFTKPPTFCGPVWWT